MRMLWKRRIKPAAIYTTSGMSRLRQSGKRRYAGTDAQHAKRGLQLSFFAIFLKAQPLWAAICSVLSLLISY